MSVHEEGVSGGTESDPEPNKRKKVRRSSSSVSWYLSDEEEAQEAPVKVEAEVKHSKIVHPDERQIDRVGSLGFLYQKTSIDKVDIENRDDSDQQMLTPVVTNGNEQPSLQRKKSCDRLLRSEESLELDSFLESDSLSGMVQTSNNNKYSELHHHAVSVDDLEEMGNESDVPMSESTSTSLVPSLKSSGDSGLGGLIRDDSLEESLVSKESSGRISPLSFVSDQSRPVSPLGVSDTESLAPLLSPLPPTPEMTYDFEDLEDDLCDEDDFQMNMDAHNSLDTPPLPEYTNSAEDIPETSDDVLDSEAKLSVESSLKETRYSARINSEKCCEPNKFEDPTKPDLKRKMSSLSDSVSRLTESSDDVIDSAFSKVTKLAHVTSRSKEPVKNTVEIKREPISNTPIGSAKDKVQNSVDTVASDSSYGLNVNVPGAFVKLGGSTKASSAKPRLPKLEQVSNKRDQQSRGKNLGTFVKGGEKIKAVVQKRRSKGAKIDDINIVPSRQHSHNPVSSRLKKTSETVTQKTQLTGATQIGAKTGATADTYNVKNSAANETNADSGTLGLGPLKQRKRISRVKSFDQTTVSQTKGSQIASSTQNSKESHRVEVTQDDEVMDLPSGKTSDQFKRRTSRFPSTRKVKSLDTSGTSTNQLSGNSSSDQKVDLESTPAVKKGRAIQGRKRSHSVGETTVAGLPSKKMVKFFE